MRASADAEAPTRGRRTPKNIAQAHLDDGARIPGRWLAAAVMIAAAMMDLIDLTVVNVALPTIRADLGASGTELEWVVSAYMRAFAALLIIAGSFGDLLGRKGLFIGGIAAFGAASLSAAALSAVRRGLQNYRGRQLRR